MNHFDKILNSVAARIEDRTDVERTLELTLETIKEMLPPEIPQETMLAEDYATHMTCVGWNAYREKVLQLISY